MTGAASAPAAHAAVPVDFVGINSEDAFVGDAAYRERTMAAQAGAGIDLTRHTFNWAEIEYAPGMYDFTRYDGYVATAAGHRIRVLPVLYNPPEFWSSRPPGRSRPGTYPPSPAGMEAFGRFAAELAVRYGRGGAFWRENPEVPKMPFFSYQVWNEPNLPQYWPSGPSARAYAHMLRHVRPALKFIDPGAEVVTAGVPDSKMGIAILPYYRALYRAGGNRLFDTLAINAYAGTARGVVDKIRAVRRLMNANGDSAARIWVTEFGWGDRAARLEHPLLVGAAQQGRRIAEAIRTMGAVRRDLRLRGFIYYGWRDGRPYAPNFRDFWGLHTGLLTVTGQPKRAMTSFREAVRRLRARRSTATRGSG